MKEMLSASQILADILCCDVIEEDLGTYREFQSSWNTLSQKTRDEIVNNIQNLIDNSN